MTSLNPNSGYGAAALATMPFTTGRIFVVCNSSNANFNDIDTLFQPDWDGTARRYSTVDAAVSACVAGRGDIVLVAPGHSETVTSSSLTLDVAGVTVMCLGNGLSRATFTYSTAAATINVSAANCSFLNGHHVANFADVAAAFTVGAAKDFRLEGNTFVDTSSILNFLSVVVTGAVNNDADGLSVVNNYFLGLATSPNAFVSVLANEKRVNISGNFCDMAATNDVGHFLTIAAKVLTGARIANNRLTVVGATTATVGIFLTGSSTTNTGNVENNFVASLDTTSELLATAGTGLKFFENYYTGTADASGKLWPVVDAA